MKNTAIIIPTRLSAKRFPNKPLVKINNLPMIIHVLNRAKESKVGEVYVATPDLEILKVVNEYGGNAILTKQDHASGSDRIYEVYLKNLQKDTDLIINLQGDLPNIKPDSIFKLEKFMRNHNCDVGTLASIFKDKNDIKDPNIVKVQVEGNLDNSNFLKVKDFFRNTNNNIKKEKIYHHIGVYAFTNAALNKYVKLSRTKLEIERNLEQMRALDNNFNVKVGLSNSLPLSVDTEEDLMRVTKDMSLA